MHRYRYQHRVLACFLATALCLASLYVFELLARRLDPLWGMTERNACRTIRPGLGGGFRVNCSCQWERRLRDGTLVFSVRLETDAHGRRVTPDHTEMNTWKLGNYGRFSPDSPSSSSPSFTSSSRTRSRLAVFLGCSFTLGAGVEASETLPAQLRGYHVVNAGASGFGPAQALALSSAPDLQGAALAVYTLIPGHIGRATGAWPVLGTYGAGFPSYVMEGDGVKLEGSFRDVHPWRVWFAEQLAGLALFRRLPATYAPEDVELTARLLLATKERLGAARFLVLAWPGKQNRELLATLRAEGMEVFEPEADEETRESLLDGHPTKGAYRRVGEMLNDYLNRTNRR